MLGRRFRGASRILALVSVVLVAGCLLSTWLTEESSSGLRALALRDAFLAWRAEQNPGEPSRLALGWSKGLSSRFTEAHGDAILDFERRRVEVEVTGGGDELGDVWLVDNLPGPGRSVKPEPGDGMVYLGRLRPEGASARLQASLPGAIADGTELDLLVVTPKARGPVEDTVLVGVPTLFQRLEQRTVRHRDERLGLLRALPVPRVLASAGAGNLDALVETGETLFFKETFAGNGRTCGTCHPAENNFTIDPAFIATLSFRDPLFVAEFVPELSENFENPKLMRGLGLILENADGFDAPSTKFTMRGVPHTLALPTSLKPAPRGADGTSTPPNQRTGWSGDGAPGGGTLREFAIGAVTQHFPRTLGRNPGIDFRLPTDEELDALEAFQLSLGRQAELDLSTLVLKDAVARRGLQIFLTADTQGGTVAAGKCNVCHSQAGASLAAAPGFNFNFDTGVEALEDHPADRINPGKRPPDGGFGTNPHPVMAGAFGNGTFNTPTLVEAADTPPFFHNNAVRTLEEAVAFYNSDAFEASPAGRFLAAADSGGIAIQIGPTQVEAVATFLRVINVLENLRSALVRLDALQLAFDAVEVRRASADIRDAILVLRGGSLHFDAVSTLESAQSDLEFASADPFFGRFIAPLAASKVRSARRRIVVE